MYRTHTASDLNDVADAMERNSAALRAVANSMTAESLEELFLQLPPATLHVHALEKATSDIHYQFRDQMRCAKTGETPAYKRKQLKNALDKEIREAKARGETLGIVKKTAAAPKKAVKKAAKGKKKS